MAHAKGASAEVRSKRWKASILPDGSSTPVLGPLSLKLHRGGNYNIYAVGSVANGSLDVIVHQI